MASQRERMVNRRHLAANIGTWNSCSSDCNYAISFGTEIIKLRLIISVSTLFFLWSLSPLYKLYTERKWSTRRHWAALTLPGFPVWLVVLTPFLWEQRWLSSGWSISVLTLTLWLIKNDQHLSMTSQNDITESCWPLCILRWTCFKLILLVRHWAPVTIQNNINRGFVEPRGGEFSFPTTHKNKNITY